ncbi:MAG: patatin-like phospholipase family protein [Clostridia bacterium]|nr:patatin-like phospholipase family protein [Clostridia bacterium]
MMKKLGLALGAGGSRGVAHIGFLQALEESNVRIDYIVGASMGSVVGGAYAAGVSLETMREAVFKLRLLDLITPAKQKGGVFGNTKMRNQIVKHLGEITFADLKIPFHCVAVDMVKQEVVEFSEGSVVDAIVASSSIPAVFPPVVMGDKRLIDGGVLERVPAMRVKKMGADVVVAVDVLGWRNASEKVSGPLGVSLETFDIMDNHRTKAYHVKHKKDIDFWLEPDLGDMSQYSLKQIREAYEVGYELGKANVAEIKKALKE